MMDEFDIFLARAYGSVDHTSPADTAVTDHHHHRYHHSHKHHGRRRSSTRRASSVRSPSNENSPKFPDVFGSDDRGKSLASPGKSHSARPSLDLGRAQERRRAGMTSQVTVAIEPPSPTEDQDGHRRTMSWRLRQGEGRGQENQGGEGQGDESRLQRTRTMPARRSPSPAARGSSQARRSLSRSKTPVIEDTSERNGYTNDQMTLNHSEVTQEDYIENLDENRNHQSPCHSPSSLLSDHAPYPSDHASLSPQDCPTSPVLGDCRIYRVRSFTTKKGGSIINRGDSIKVCSGSGRRASSIMLDTMMINDVRRKSTSGNSLLPTPSSGHLRRRSTSGLLMNVKGLGANPGEYPATAPAIVGENVRRLSTSSGGRRSSDQGPGGFLLPSLSLSPDGSLCPPEAGFNFSIDNDVIVTADQNDERAYLIVDDLVGEGGEGEGEPPVMRVAVLGSQGVGKSTLTRQLLTSEYLANVDSAELDDCSSDQIVSVQIDDEESTIQFIDQQDSDEPTPDCTEIDGYLVVYSVTDRTSFLRAQALLQELRGASAPKASAVILVANKQDLVRNRTVSESEGKKLASKRECRLVEVSALIDHKVDELLVAMIREIRAELMTSRGHQAMTSCAPGVAMGDKNDVSKGCIQKAALGILKKLFK